LPSLALVEVAIHDQQNHLSTGQLTDTGKPADKFVQNPPPPNFGPHSSPAGGDPSSPASDPGTTPLGADLPALMTVKDGQISHNPQIPGLTIPRSFQLQPPFGP
jgi:hypothetical protein